MKPGKSVQFNYGAQSRQHIHIAKGSINTLRTVHKNMSKYVQFNWSKRELAQHKTTQNNTAKYNYYTELMNESSEDMTRSVVVKKFN